MNKIIFQEYLVPGIEVGTVTETRRMHGLKKIHGQKDLKMVDCLIKDGYLFGVFLDNAYPDKPIRVKSKFRIGQIIYIAEPFFYLDNGKVLYKYNCKSKSVKDLTLWKSPIYLKEKDARIKIQIVSIDIQRVELITDKECIDSGIVKESEDRYRVPGRHQYHEHSVLAFADLWDTINPEYHFKSDPVCFAYKFEKIATKTN